MQSVTIHFKVESNEQYGTSTKQFETQTMINVKQFIQS